MEIRSLSKQIQSNSLKFAELMSATSSILKYSKEAEEVRNYLLERVPYPVSGFNFGYFPTNDQIKLLSDRINIDDLVGLGLFYEKEIYEAGYPQKTFHGTLSNHNLIMPYKNQYGDIIGIVGRTLLSKEDQKEKKISKYKNSSILKMMNLFGLYEAKKFILERDCVFVVEGQIDCITCHRFGMTNVVALGGATFTGYHLALLKRYTNNIHLILDNDEAGNKSIDKIFKRFSDKAKLRKWTIPPPYKDIDGFLTNTYNTNYFNVNY